MIYSYVVYTPIFFFVDYLVLCKILVYICSCKAQAIDSLTKL